MTPQNVTKGLFTPNESASKSENDQRINDKYQRKVSVSLGMNGPQDVFLSSSDGTLVNLTVKILGERSTRDDPEDHRHKQGSTQEGIQRINSTVNNPFGRNTAECACFTA